MGQAIEITRTEYSASDLRAIAARQREGAQVRRLLALALVLEGATRTDAANQSGMDRRTRRALGSSLQRGGHRGPEIGPWSRPTAGSDRRSNG